jgi:hypothetical protein
MEGSLFCNTQMTPCFFCHDLEKAGNLKLLLVAFEQVYGLKINYHKSELFCFGMVVEEEHRHQHIFGCKKGG